MSQAQPPAVAGAAEAPSANKAMIAGIISIFCNLLFIPPILAIIWGNAAKKEIAASGGTLGGDGKATFAVVVGWIIVALGVVGLVLYAILLATAASNQ